ncbi:protein of unknown function (DUF1986) [Tyrophagus putrescentiae]|nr:protein of unknown function (DUF1986) [Tyrophagus putrescentiae]
MIFFSLLYTTLFFLVLKNQSSTTAVSNQENEARIVGGNKSAKGQWPFMAALFNAKNRFFCGGSVWDEWHVITASHCLLNEYGKISVYLGHTYIVKKTINLDYMITVNKVIIHKYYNDSTDRFDIALLRLDQPIDFGRRHTGVSCVCAPEPLENLDLPNCRTMGWGSVYPYKNKTIMSAALREVQMPVLEFRFCYSRNFNRHWNLCAKNPIPFHDSCVGDSGGPLVCPVKNVSPTAWALTGITSFGPPTCGHFVGMGYYTQVYRLLHWIEKNTQLD